MWQLPNNCTSLSPSQMWPLWRVDTVDKWYNEEKNQWDVVRTFQVVLSWRTWVTTWITSYNGLFLSLRVVINFTITSKIYFLGILQYRILPILLLLQVSWHIQGDDFITKSSYETSSFGYRDIRNELFSLQTY